MIIGTLLRTATTASATHYYSPWMPARGNRGSFRCDILAAANLENEAGFEITVQTKNREQDDKSATSFAPQSIDTGADHHGWVDGVGLDASSGQGLLELVRIKYSLTAKTSDGGWIHFRMLGPQWFVN